MNTHRKAEKSTRRAGTQESVRHHSADDIDTAVESRTAADGYGAAAPEAGESAAPAGVSAAEAVAPTRRSSGSALRTVRAYAAVLGKSFTVNLKAAAEYRGNFLIQVFGMALNNACFLVFWNVLLERTGSIAGYGFQEVMFIWAMASAAFGLGHIVFGNVRRIGLTIVNGELDIYLMQPKDPFFAVLTARTQLSAWGDLLFGLVLFVVVSQGNPVRILMMIIFSVSGAILYVSMFAIVESLSFSIGRSSGVSRAFLELMLTSTLYPETIFGPQIRWLFYSLLPAGFIAFIPLRSVVLLRWDLLLLVAAAACAYAGLACLVFRRGLRRYESGNLMTTRL